MRIFVYGSLRTEARQQPLDDQRPVAGKLHNRKLPVVQSGPLSEGAVPGNGTVQGEVYRIDNATLAELDALRTGGGEYARQLIQTPYGSAWMYVYQRSVDGLTLIESGNWLDRDQF
ncbi:gamma-glutamylcyclotransferase [Enterobacter hormaechei]|uniref:Gamma-glutamylcyclotransferase family protein YtfP n=1 Tax=Enterobacter hormaechei TaxID=158836 RepID=A0A927DM84_9ENTR|nr:gamma-glutamylcyclotransferase [Enterobacter hormaechei]